MRANRAGWRNKKVSGETTLTRMWLLSAVAVVLGLVGGGAAVGLFKLIALMTHLTLLHDVGFDLPTLRGYHPDGWMVVTVVAGGLLVSLFALWAPVIRGHGIPESLEAILGRDARIRPRAAVAKPLSAAITIGTGGPFGAEGPIIVTGGSIGSLIGQALAVSPAERKIMLATGAAAGMSATFNTPVAAVILAIELVLFERSLRAIVPLSIACGIAAAIHVVAFGSRPLFFVAAHLHVSLAHLPLFVVVGAASGLLAVVLNRGLFAMEAAFRRLPVNIFWWPAIGALGFGLIGLFVPRTLSMGYSAITDTLNGHFTVTMLAVLFVAKLFSWWIALGSQTSGGTLAPMFLVGATMGCLLGHAANAVWPGLHVSPAAFALVAMGATFGAATKALFAAVVFATEVTGQFGMAIPLLVASGVAELVAQAFLSDRLMTEKLSHRGFRVEFRTVVDALRMRVVRQVMREPVVVPATATVDAARGVMVAHGLPVIAVVDEQQHYLGLLRLPGPAGAHDGSGTVRGAVSSAISPLDPDEYLSTSLERFIVNGVAALPVVEGGRVVGQLDRADIAAERHRCSTVLETRQAGWLTGVRARWHGGRPASLPGGGYSKIIIPFARGAAAARPGPDDVAARVGSTDMAHRNRAKNTAGTVGAMGTVGGVAGPRPGVAGGRLVPHPHRVEPRLGQFTLTERSRIVVAWDSAGAVAVADYLASALRPATGLRLAVSHGRAYRDDICLRLGPSAELPDPHSGQGYVLDVGMAGVTLTAATTHGLYNGVQTIRQLLPVWIASSVPVPRVWAMPSTHIADLPQVGLRSVLLDLTGAVPTPSTVMHLVDDIAAYKLNVLRLRLPARDAERLLTLPGNDLGTARPVPSAAGDAGPGWTAEDYRRLVEFAAARFVAVIPEVGEADPDRVANGAAVGGRLLALTQGMAVATGGGWPREALLAATAGGGPARDVVAPARPQPVLLAAPPVAAVRGAGNAVGGLGAGPAGGPAGSPVSSPAGDAAGTGTGGSDGSSPSPVGIVDLYRVDRPAGAHRGFDETGAALPPLEVADRAEVERLLFPRLLAVAENAWTPACPAGTARDFLARVAPHGAKLALAGTAVTADPAVPWRLHVTGMRPVMRRRTASGRLAILAAPGRTPDGIDVRIDWGDGMITAATLSAAGPAGAGPSGAGPAGAGRTGSRAAGAGAIGSVPADPRGVGRGVEGLFDIAGSHRYPHAGMYLVAITATASGTAPARTTVALRVRGLRPPARTSGGADGQGSGHGEGYGAGRGAPEPRAAAAGRAQQVGEGEPAGT